MRNTRVCESAEMSTGGSACKVDWGKVKGAILVEHGVKLPANITADELEKSVMLTDQAEFILFIHSLNMRRMVVKLRLVLWDTERTSTMASTLRQILSRFLVLMKF